MSTCQEALALDPEHRRLLRAAGLVALWSGDSDLARSYFEKTLPVRANFTRIKLRRISTLLGHIHSKAGDLEQAQEMLSISLGFDAVEKIRGGESATPNRLFDIASVHAIKGEKDEAYQWLERAIDAGWRYYDITSRDRIWANFHNQPRFRQMMAEVKFEVDEIRRRVEAMAQEWE